MSSLSLGVCGLGPQAGLATFSKNDAADRMNTND